MRQLRPCDRRAREARLQLEDGALVVYPESDGQPRAESTLQFQWITVLKLNLDVVRATDFVAGDLFWYPVEGHPEIVRAPDVLVAIGRPRGDRGSYRQWEEDDVAPQVVFEVRSPSNTASEMAEKLRFYDRYGVSEYYEIDPEDESLKVWLRPEDGGALRATLPGRSFESPRLGIRFSRQPDGSLQVLRPDGERFLTFEELHAQRDALRERAESEARRAESEARRADAAEARLEALERRLRELGVED